MDEPVKYYKLDLNKLVNAVDNKRKQSRLSWQRVANRMGVKSETTFHNMLQGRIKTGQIQSDTLVRILMYLNKPITDFVYEIEEVKTNNANTPK